MFGTAELTDEVVRTAAEGSQRELEHVLASLEPQVHLMVAARLSPTRAQFHLAEDVVQQVMLAVTSGLARLQQRTVNGLKAFVSGIVRRQVAELIRKRGREGGRGGPVRSLDTNVAIFSQAGPLWQFLSGSVTSPRSAVARSEQTARLMTELGRLKPEHHEVIILAFFDQLPTSEIAADLNISPAAASMLLLRAVRTLRQRMREVSQEESSDGAPA